MVRKMGLVILAGVVMYFITIGEVLAVTVSYVDATSPVVYAECTGTTNYFRAVDGYASGASGYTYGVYGRSASDSGNGVYGSATAATGATNGVYGMNASTSGRGVYGYTTTTTGTTYGVYGRSASTSGRGVYGYTTAATGLTYGVYGQSDSTAGYGVYSQGNMHVTGNITIADDKKIPRYINKAITATPAVTASSEYPGMPASFINDNKINRWNDGEWASNGGGAGSWAQLTWPSAQTINEVWIYDRPNKYDKIYDAYLQIDQDGDGNAEYNLELGMFPYGGAAKVIYLTQDEGTTVKSMKLYITEVSPSTKNIGLSEIQCYYDPNRW